MSFADTQRTLIKSGEGAIRHMYLDTRGYVTVGVGHMMPGAADAQTLPFVHRDTGDAASADEIAADYNAVKARPYGQSYTAHSFAPYTRLILPDSEIDALLDRRIAEFETGLRRDFNGFDDFPERARLGLLDMAFNLGNSGLVNKFPSFTAAARAGNWAKCAEECHRNGISNTRNDEVRQLFEDEAADII